MTNGFYGVYLNQSDHNDVSVNGIVDNSIGICGFNASHNTINGNSIKANSFAGINFHLCNSNQIAENDIERNSKGMHLLDKANQNIIYRNNFISNAGQVAVVNSYENVWDNGYPSGGNYWSDHNPPDENGDKIGDIPYTVGGGIADRYPLIYLCKCYQPSYVPSLDINEDGVVNIVDLARVAKAFGCEPGDLNWDPEVDLDINETVNIIDITLVAKDYGKTA